MFLKQSREILLHAAPMLIAQLASMGMMIIDTVLLGHHGTEDLAAAAVGSGIYVAVVFALTGVLQAVSPTVSHLKGAGRDDEIAGALQQCFWLALILTVPGVVFLQHPDALLQLSAIESGVEAKTRAYLALLAWGMPAALFYRTFYAFSNALGHPRPLMLISLGGTLLHGGVAWWLATQAGLGVIGCGISNVMVGWFSLACAAIFMLRGKAFAVYRLVQDWQPPRLPAMGELVRLGLPMGFSNFVEISAFTLTSLFVAQLGAPVVAGHRVVANLAAICYMLPLAVSIATLAQVGLAAGAHDWRRARVSISAGLVLASVLATLLGGALWLAERPLVTAYTSDPAVRAVALSLIGYVVVYQLFDAVQTVAAFALRGYKITFLPMFVHLFCFWGVGLFGGWWLAFRQPAPMGVAGFWAASLVSLVLAALLLGGMLWRAVQARR
ncbi:MATE family efflux transporter [Propionivibrio dicarboxylicus]|uniref:Multidrug resistance protein, MATE family n=1 Tax=Propionivibrio dicarboxylicus TaxID=83767 RepID=A0A1G8FPL8_9RHOO|nr:MATE family efflux transporter [Propionivibrio dicarboxylicus]SDH84065.1 multidrug resistance protein, MATE family [Propionivibrio dicarboxylicus]